MFANSSSALISKKCGAQSTLGGDAWAMSNGSRLKLRASVRSFGRAGSLSVAREGRICIGRLKCGAVLRLTHVLGIRAVRFSRNWPRAHRSESQRHCAYHCVPANRCEDRLTGNNRLSCRNPPSLPAESYLSIRKVAIQHAIFFNTKPIAILFQDLFILTKRLWTNGLYWVWKKFL